MSSSTALTDLQRTAVLRADASAGVGVGHAVRSLALGTALVGIGWKVVLVTTNIPDAIAARAHASSIDVHLLNGPPHGAADAAAVLALEPDLVVADGYRFESAFYESFFHAGPVLCAIDDNGENFHPATHIIVNQNPSALDVIYGSPSAPRALLLGLRYALVRPEVRAARDSPPTDERAGVFVSMGGSDPLGLGERLATAFSRSGILARVALGPAMDEREAVFARVQGLSGVSVVTDPDFVTALGSASLAVIGAGTTMWEAACLGVPTISVIVADNQAAPATAATDIGLTLAVDARAGASPAAVEHATRELLADGERRDRMTRIGRSEVDGEGATRVATFLSEFTVDRGRTPC